MTLPEGSQNTLKLIFQDEKLLVFAFMYDKYVVICSMFFFN